MDKLVFWLMVVVVSIVGIWGFKAVAAKSGNAGIADFASQI